MINIFATCTPRSDVLSGSIAEADFAADLAKVIRGVAHVDYQDPARFFANTYPTGGLKNLLRQVMGRLVATAPRLPPSFAWIPASAAVKRTA